MAKADESENFFEFDHDALKVFIERVEAVAADKDALADDITEIFGEAKDAGFNTKVMRQTVAARKRERTAVQGERKLFDAYMDALGDFADTDLGGAAVKTVAPVTQTRREKAAAAKSGTAAKPAKAAKPPAAPKHSAEEAADAKELGRRGRIAGKMRESNPCEASSVDAQMWDAGWLLGDQEIEDEAARADVRNGGAQPAVAASALN